MTSARQTRFRPGSGTAIVAGHAVGLVDGDAESTAVLAIDAGLGRGDGLDELMTALSSVGFSALPAFALAITAPSGVQLLYRGAVTVEVAAATGVVAEYRDPGVSTWREELVADGAVVRLGLSRSSGQPAHTTHWISVGVVPADAVEWSPHDLGIATLLGDDAPDEDAMTRELSEPLVLVAPPAPTAPPGRPADDEHDGHTVARPRRTSSVGAPGPCRHRRCRRCSARWSTPTRSVPPRAGPAARRSRVGCHEW